MTFYCFFLHNLQTFLLDIFPSQILNSNNVKSCSILHLIHILVVIIIFNIINIFLFKLIIFSTFYDFRNFPHFKFFILGSIKFIVYRVLHYQRWLKPQICHFQLIVMTYLEFHHPYHKSLLSFP
jgi:hypothetical protein